MNGRSFAKILLRAQGWKARIDAPLPQRCVIIGEPHTSNWDGWYMVLGSLALDLQARWVIKAEHDRGAIGDLLRRTGAMFIERGKGGVVAGIVAEFAKGGPLRLAIAPAGTRKRTERWKTGFLQIARAADVPIVMGFVDYGRKEVGVGPALDPHLPDRELERLIADYYRDRVAKVPANCGPVRFAADDAGDVEDVAAATASGDAPGGR